MSVSVSVSVSILSPTFTRREMIDNEGLGGVVPPSLCKAPEPQVCDLSWTSARLPGDCARAWCGLAPERASSPGRAAVDSDGGTVVRSREGNMR